MTLAKIIELYVKARVRSGSRLADVLDDVGVQFAPDRLDELRREWWLAAVTHGSGDTKSDV